MGQRTLKRVPLDFQWPLKKVWKGYINPHPGPAECFACNGTGYNPETKRIADEFYDHEGFGARWYYEYGVAPDGTPATRPPWRIIGECRHWCNNITQDEVQALVDEGRLKDFTHDFVPGRGWVKKDPPYIPTAQEVNEWERRGGLSGHDAINRGILIEARAKRLGVYGHCQVCNGGGEIPHPNPEVRKMYEEWEEYEPPSGGGWQLWETTSEGSPISPVFALAEELAEWCEENATLVGNEKTSKTNWLRMFLGEESLEAGSLMIMGSGYFGALANLPKRDD